MRLRPRRGTPADLLVVGLGNPGDEYRGSRHNLGAEVVDLLATRYGGRLRKRKERALVDEVTIDGCRVALAIPLTYVNDSGNAVAALVRRFGVDPEQLVVVHDELDDVLQLAPPGIGSPLASRPVAVGEHIIDQAGHDIEVTGRLERRDLGAAEALLAGAPGAVQ